MFRVYIERRHPFFLGLTVWVHEKRGAQAVLHTHDGRFREVSESTVPEPDDYFCRIPPGSEHALLAELARTLGAVEHPEQLRRDFELLRARYDLLVDNLVTLTQRRSPK